MAQTELRLDGLGIRKIVEIPPGIKVLSISSNRLRNLGSIVECLTLQEVNLAANKLDEAALAPLAALPALRTLNISRNQIRDLAPLVSAPTLSSKAQAFPALEELNVSSNPLGDVTAAMSLQVLRVLTAASLAATTLQCVHCSLEVIDLRNCCLQSVSGLQALPYLTELILDGNALLSCKDLVAHSSLQALRLAHNAIGDISAVQLPCLTELDLASNSLSEALTLAGAPRLVSLVLRSNQLTSLVQLSALRCLTFLDASQNKIRGLEPSLRWSLRPLRVLLLNGNEIQDVEDVAKAMEMAGGLALEHLDLRDNPLSSCFYPFAERLPTWTWEARASFASFVDSERDPGDREKPPLDIPLGVRDRYCNRLTSICPSLQSLDGLLVDGQPTSGHVFRTISEVDRRSAVPGGMEDEVLYSTPRQSKEAKGEDQPGRNAGDPGLMVEPLESTASKPHDSRNCEVKIVTSDAATSPIFRERSHSDGQMSSLANLGLRPELLEAQRKDKQGTTVLGTDTQQEMVLAMEVAAAAAAAAVAANCGSKRSNGDQDDPARADQGSGASRTTRLQWGFEDATVSEESGLPVVDLRARAERGLGENFNASLRTSAGSTALQSSKKKEQQQVGGRGPVQTEPEEDLMQGQDFEVEQLHIVEKLEKAHQELAKQWQELDVERQKSNEEQVEWQEEQRQRIQLFAQEQAEVQAGLKMQFESEVQKSLEQRHEWETHQQQFLEQQQQRLEDQWQREQERRKQQWEKEQEEEFLKLQHRFQRLQQQFQERLDSASQTREGEVDARTRLDLQKSSDTSQETKPPEGHQGSGDRVANPGAGCLQGCLRGFQQRSKAPKELKTPQEPLVSVVDTKSRVHAEHTNKNAAVSMPGSTGSTGTQALGRQVAGRGAEGIFETGTADLTPVRPAAEPNASSPEARNYDRVEPTSAEPQQSGRPLVPLSEPVALSPSAEPAAKPVTLLRQDILQEPVAQNPKDGYEIQQRQQCAKHLGFLHANPRSRSIQHAPSEESKAKCQNRIQELPGSDGAFQRALHGRGIWQVEEHEQKDWSSLKITASLDADHRVVLEEEQTGVESKHAPWQQVSPTSGFSPKKEEYLKFLQKEIAAQRAFLRDIKKAKKAGHCSERNVDNTARPCGDFGQAKGLLLNARAHPGQAHTKQGKQAQRGGSEDDASWHCVVSPVNAGVRGALEALISQQAWSMPERPFAYLYSLGRAIQNSALPARKHFDALVSRDAAREGVLSPLGFSQRAFFCDKNNKLSEVIASPFGFGTVYSGMAILVALELRHAERLCWPETAHLTGRTIVTEIALGRCHTSHILPAELADLYSKGSAGAIPLAKGLESEYRRGADSVYFPQMGIIAILSPTRALPVFLAEYSREFVGASASKVATTLAG